MARIKLLPGVLRKRVVPSSSSCSSSSAVSEVAKAVPKWPVGGDTISGCGHNLTLSAPGILPKLCCWFPGVVLWSIMLLMVTSAYLWPSVFYTFTAGLTLYAVYYSSDLSISSMVGTWKMRQAAREDWHVKFSTLVEKEPEAANVLHVVILPNYKEDELMLLRTLENIAASPMARQHIKVILAMEAREGQVGADKATRLIEKTRPLFADIFATFHPANLPGDLAGKSSNTQWAYQQMLTRYSSDFSGRDTSKVILTVGDADTLFHVQYWSALAYQALTTPLTQRVWCFWQPPVLLLRNIFSPPGITRLSGYATCLFELAGLANQNLTSAFCYSSYSMTLALANHRLVRGWDRDVIAEDHHMFCKCFFASIWESTSTHQTGESRVTVQPVFLPALSYLVESNDGWSASVYERFRQACRHSQGVSEISYTLLNYVSLMQEFGVTGLSFRSHRAVWAIIYKMIAVHIVNPVQAFSVFVTICTLVPILVRWVFGGGLIEMLQLVYASGLTNVSYHTSFGGLASWTVYTIFGPIPPMTIMMTATSFFIIRELLQGNLTGVVDPKCWNGNSAGKIQTVSCQDVQGMSKGPLSIWSQLQLLYMVQSDYLGKGHYALFVLGLIPILKATASLVRNGNNFEYIVAAKPV